MQKNKTYNKEKYRFSIFTTASLFLGVIGMGVSVKNYILVGVVFSFLAFIFGVVGFWISYTRKNKLLFPTVAFLLSVFSIAVTTSLSLLCFHNLF